MALKLVLIKKILSFSLAGCIGLFLFCLSSQQYAFTQPLNANATHYAGIINQTPSKAMAQHLVNRLTFGARPNDVDYVRQVGIEAFIREQLDPLSIAEPPELTRKLQQLKTIHYKPDVLFALYSLQSVKNKLPKSATPEEQKKNKRAVRKKARLVLTEASQARLMRAVESNRQLEEVMVDFWFNHFNIYAKKGTCNIWTGSFEDQAIRPYALGNFRDLLGATAQHPAMMFYLDNWQNTAEGSKGAKGRFKGLNENYARELLELHTLGVDGGYTQQDVENLARVLTGWGISPGTMEQKRFRLKNKVSNQRAQQYLFKLDARYPHFSPFRHDFSNKLVLNRLIKGSGPSEVEQVLNILAYNPATAKHISYKLAQYFVNDTPPEGLVIKLAQVYSESRGNIRSVLYALFTSDEFWSEENRHNKFKTPYHFTIASVRSTGLSAKNYQFLIKTQLDLGMPLYGHITPDGYKNTTEAWLDPGAMIKRVSFATALGKNYYPLVHKKTETKANVSTQDVLKSMEPQLSLKTRQRVQQTVPELRAALLLGSPEAMMY